MDRSDISPVRGLVGGVLAYVVGYLVTYLWQAPSVRDTLETVNVIIEIVGGETVPTWKAVGWIFYNAHAVDLTLPALGSGSATRSLVGNGGAPTLLYVVPPLLLLVTGAAVAWWASADGAAGGAVAGGSIVLGYLILAVVGAFLVRYTFQESFVGPVTAHAVLLAGIVYPVVFGSIGGALAGELR